MPLNLIYITNKPEVALIAQSNGVQRIMVDLETLGKDERQKNMNSVKSNHTVDDAEKIAKVLTSSSLLVRVNPWNENSAEEIEAVIAAGADSIMLPMWKSAEEVDAFLKLVNRRVETTLLLETKEAVECLDSILEHPLIDNIHIGLNDLHLSYGLTFMFEPLVNGMVEEICGKCKAKGIPYGIGGIAKLSKGLVPAEYIIMEHYRLGSTAAILSRTFCNAEEIGDLDAVKQLFAEQMVLIRDFERTLPARSAEDFEDNRHAVAGFVREAVEIIRQRRANQQT